MTAYEFTWLDSGAVQSSTGFIVERTTRYNVEYIDPPKKLTVYVEPGRIRGNGSKQEDKRCVLISASSFERWDGDPPDVTLSPQLQRELLANFIAAIEFQGYAVIVG